MIKLCYKEYSWKLSNGARKSFEDQTGLDLETVFGDYLEESLLSMNKPLISRMQSLSKLYSRKIATKALHAIIKAADDSIPLAEIEDACYRVSWQLSDKPDDLSEPWPIVMYLVALDMNDYFNNNLPKKKADT